MKEMGMKRGQPITFRIPSDTPDHILKHLQQLKEVEKRNFSSTIASLVVHGLNDSLAKQRETITIPLPKALTKEQRDWLKHEHSEALLGSIVYQLMADPIRTASIFASLNSNALEIDDALYLQEESAATDDLHIDWDSLDQSLHSKDEERETHPLNDSGEDDLENFDFDRAKVADDLPNEEEDEMDDPLADFLAQMNK
ncbi:hypothetical protein GN156_06920 [bacterium LRH843]|nr:hypothetical protein [bacterium LRH843]